MKLIPKLSALGASLVMMTAFASADIIASNSSTVTYEGYRALGGPYPTPSSFVVSSQPTYDLNNVTPTWDAALPGSSWVGISPNAGPENTVNPAQGYYLFAYTFTGATGTLNALSVYADDTTSVWLNDAQIIMSGNLGSDFHCSDNAPSCIDNKYGSLTSAVAINNGDILYFVVEDKGSNNPGGSGNPSGLDFIGLTNPGRSTSPVPEPTSLVLLGTGLFGSAGMLIRRRRPSQS